jgi:hypothetical protein
MGIAKKYYSLLILRMWFVGSVEDISKDELKTESETNFLGVLELYIS